MSVEFVDTNVLVYAYDPTTPAKHTKASELLTRLWNDSSGVISVQILQEFYWTIARKVPKPLQPAAALDIIEELATWDVYSPTAHDVVEAVRLSSRRRIAFWDAMIVQAAIRSEATVLWTEDLSAGAEFDGVIIRNPFA